MGGFSSGSRVGDPDLISAKAFAAQSAVWHRATPTLEQFTRWVNRGPAAFGSAYVSSASAPERRSLIAEVAFESAASGTSRITADVFGAARRRLERLPHHDQLPGNLTRQEREEAARIRRNIEAYLESYTKGAPPRFRPLFSGCGIVEEAEGDVVAGTQLIEIKAVTRGFRGTDFRQVLTYAALAHAKSTSFETVALVNPRARTYYRSSAEGLALDIGAGSWVELMQDLIASMSELSGVSD